MSKYQHILVATDFSRTSEVAVQQAVDLAAHYGANLTCLHVVEHFPDHLPHYKIAHEGMDAEHFLLDRAGADLNDLCQRLGRADARQEVRLTTHSAKSEIVKFAKENPTWGFDRIQGELAKVGYPISDTTVGNILKAHGIEPAPTRMPRLKRPNALVVCFDHIDARLRLVISFHTNQAVE